MSVTYVEDDETISNIPTHIHDEVSWIGYLF